MTAIIKLEGVGEVYAAKLREAGINSVEAILKKCATPQGRKDLATTTDISDKLIVEWANRADLARIKVVGTQYSDLLEATGVDTVPKLAQRNPKNLYQAMVSANETISLVRKLPTENQGADWVNQAKALPRALTY
jgi:predicted flap endonuclease-1-like 5' DNA nuclease